MGHHQEQGCTAREGRQRGFTFIEILIVMGIIAVLAGGIVVALNIWGRRGPELKSRTTVAAVESLAQAWRAQFNQFPPGDVRKIPLVAGFGGKLKGAMPNDTNMGIEAFVQAVQIPGFKTEHSWGDGQLANTDEDQLTKALATSGVPDLREVLDAWGNPLIYFHSHDYARLEEGQDYVIGENSETEFAEAGDTVTARPHRDGDGQYRNPNTFQVFSMGADGAPNTEDDIGNW